MTETWKAIAGYEGLYEVSDLGRVKSLNYNRTRMEKILKLGQNHKGYLQVSLCKDGHEKTVKVHRLVAEAFIQNPNNLDTVNHKDEDKTNNIVSNLEWMSNADNNNYGTRNKRIAEANINNPNRSKQVNQLNKQGNLLATFPSGQEAERQTGIHRGHISECCLGKRKLAGGFIWRYA